MTYLQNLLHDIRMAVAEFIYIRRYLRRGGNPDERGF